MTLRLRFTRGPRTNATWWIRTATGIPVFLAPIQRSLASREPASAPPDRHVPEFHIVSTFCPTRTIAAHARISVRSRTRHASRGNANVPLAQRNATACVSTYRLIQSTAAHAPTPAATYPGVPVCKEAVYAVRDNRVAKASVRTLRTTSAIVEVADSPVRMGSFVSVRSVPPFRAA